ncbi:hypothetical protein CEXT_378381, partial [Caerostris extrusa]
MLLGFQGKASRLHFVRLKLRRRNILWITQCKRRAEKNQKSINALLSTLVAKVLLWASVRWNVKERPQVNLGDV